MRIVFFGTSAFSVGILDCLRGLGHSLAAIVTRPDRQQGRSLKFKGSPVKEFALQFLPEVPLLQPEKASTEAFCQELKAFNADLFLVVAYGEILKQNILSIPSKACVNIHTSLLPKYRGASPIQSCLMNGDTVSGVTFMEMALKMDAGDVLKQEVVSVGFEMNAADLERALLDVSKNVLPEFLSSFDAYYMKKTAQDDKEATFVSKISSDDCVPDWSQSAEEIHNQIRALSPFPGVFIKLQFGSDVKRLKILSSQIEPFSSGDYLEPPGHLSLGRDSMKIFCKDALISFLSVQLEGKKVMQVGEFLRGTSKHFSVVQ